MSIRASYRVYCTNCNRESLSDAEGNPEEALANAKAIGWKQFHVPNCSIWEVCPACLPRFQGVDGYAEVK